jgi:hypothetical protein
VLAQHLSQIVDKVAKRRRGDVIANESFVVTTCPLDLPVKLLMSFLPHFNRRFAVGLGTLARPAELTRRTFRGASADLPPPCESRKASRAARALNGDKSS